MPKLISLKIKENTAKFLKDMIPVVMGVLIALFINNWNENRKERKYIDKIMVSIKKELIETNKDIIKQRTPQKRLIDTLTVYLNNDKVNLFDAVVKGGGFYAPTIKLNYWKAISNSKPELLDYETLASLAVLEEGKNLLRLKTEKLISFHISNVKSTDKNSKRLVMMLMQEIIRDGEYMQKEIEKVLKN